jgi:hypothetical protein
MSRPSPSGEGHATNPEFLSTSGVQIALSGTVEIGAGVVWDRVYANPERTGVNVVGARPPGPSVWQGSTDSQIQKSSQSRGPGKCLTYFDSTSLLRISVHTAAFDRI